MPNRPKGKLRILVYGVDSTPDPYPGVGIARSLRLAFPDCELVAVDHSPNSSGLRWPDFDDWLILTDLSHLERLCASLTRNEYLVPCVDDTIYGFTTDVTYNKQV